MAASEASASEAFLEEVILMCSDKMKAKYMNEDV